MRRDLFDLINFVNLKLGEKGRAKSAFHYTKRTLTLLECGNLGTTSIDQEKLGDLQMRTSIPRQDWAMFSHRRLQEKE